MPLILVDGCEDFSSFAPVSSASIVAGRTGNGFGVANASPAVFTIPAAQESDTVTLGFAHMDVAASTNVGHIVQLCSDAGATVHVELTSADSGGTQLRVRRGTSGTGFADSPFGVTVPGAWQYIEFQCKLSDTVGTAIVRVNGTTVLNLSGLDTKNAGTKTTFDTIKFYSGNGTANSGRFDDVYVMTGAGDSFLGDCIVETLYPNGDGNASAFLGSDGNSVSNFALVNENPAVTTTYTGSPTIGAQDVYALSNLVSSGAVLAVCHQAIVAKSDAGAKTFSVVNHRAADTKTAFTPTTTFVPYHYVLVVDPETGVAWTTTNVNALQSGVEVTS